MSNQNQEISLEEYLRKIEQALPPNYYVQQIPAINSKLGYFPRLSEEMKGYNSSALLRNGLRDGNRVLTLNLFLDIASHCASGDYAELGTYEGNSARIIWKHLGSENKLFCFDTFEGFDVRDVAIEQKTTGVGVQPGQFSAQSIEDIKARITDDKIDYRLVIRKGYFPESFEGLEERKWRFVHLDCDLYEPTINGLASFWPGLVPGGVLLIHDYNGVFKGVKQAVDEFFLPMGIVPVPCCDKAGTAVIIKNR